MGAVNCSELPEKYFKNLTAAERGAADLYLAGLKDSEAASLFEIAEIFLKTGSVNGAWFWRAMLPLAKKLKHMDVRRWAEEGARICRSSRDCVLPFLKASSDLADMVEPGTFLQWAAVAAELARFSTTEANWFCRNAGTVLGALPASERTRLVTWTADILKQSWPAAAACFKAWPRVAACLDDCGKKHLLRLALQLASVFPEDAAVLFPAVPSFVAKAGPEKLTDWINPAYLIENGRRGVVAAYLSAVPGVIDKVGGGFLAERLAEWIAWANRLAGTDSTVAAEFFKNSPGVLNVLKWSDLGQWAGLVDRVCRDGSPEVAVEFIRATPELLFHLEFERLGEWVDNGLQGVAAGKRPAYFSLKDQESRDMMARLRTGLYLESVQKVLHLYCEGLTGETVFIRNAAELPDLIHGHNRLFTSLDTRRIYLPGVIRKYREERDNLRLYRVMLMHQYAHQRFGSLQLPKEQFKELAGNEILGALFEYIEDNRVDYLAMRDFPGLHRDMATLLGDEKSEGDPEQQGIFHFLKSALWPGGSDGNGTPADECRAAYRQFWQRVTEDGASAEESLALARRLVQMVGSSAVLRIPDNIFYRGRLRYDLIYKAMEVDEEVNGDDAGENRSRSAGAGRDEEISFADIEFRPDENTINLHSEFYLRLKQLLYKFYEDEENPYRMVAFYDEWDRTLNDYKKDWCRVREIMLKPSSGRFVTRTLAEHYGMISTLKRYFGMLRPDRFRKYGRQPDGEEIDIDAVIEAMVEKKAGASPTGGFYIRRDKRERDVAVGFLLDLSYSTDEVIAGSGKTLLDVEKEAVIVMAEALEVLGDKYAIYGFNSDRRDKINFYVVKDFEETYSEEVRQRFGGLQSYGMTRLGAAVRHAASKIEKVQAAVKILILLSDGRPFDFDYNSGFSDDYEEFFPEADTRVALREARMKGVNPFCITVDAKGQDYLEYIFGNVSYIIIDDVNALPTKLTETYKNLTT